MRSPSPPDTLAPESRPPHVLVGATPIFDGDLRSALDLCFEAIASRTGGAVATANLDFLALARRDGGLRDDLARAWLVVADGAPVAWLARRLGAPSARRVAGVDLVAGLMEHAQRVGGLRIAIYGSSEDVAARAIDQIRAKYPAVTVVSAIHPPFRPLSPEEEEAHLAELVAAEPHVCLIALGCPRQERLIARYHSRHPAVWIGVGGTLDFFAGERIRAPRWAQSAGLEWGVRLLQEPRRLWRRYLLRDVPELIALVSGAALTRVRRASAG